MPDLAAELVLASASPRRSQLLREAGIAFRVEPPEIEERAGPGEAPQALVERLAREKARAVAGRLSADGARGRVVLGADTVVVLGREVLGKPRDAAHAEELLTRLCGRQHVVWTGVALVAPGEPIAERVASVASRVWLRPASAAEIRAYVATGEPLDKAGAYAFQGEGRRLVLRVEGSETNVIGLPMDETLALLAASGVATGSR